MANRSLSTRYARLKVTLAINGSVKREKLAVRIPMLLSSDSQSVIVDLQQLRSALMAKCTFVHENAIISLNGTVLEQSTALSEALSRNFTPGSVRHAQNFSLEVAIDTPPNVASQKKVIAYHRVKGDKDQELEILRKEIEQLRCDMHAIEILNQDKVTRLQMLVDSLQGYLKTQISVVNLRDIQQADLMEQLSAARMESSELKSRNHTLEVEAAQLKSEAVANGTMIEVSKQWNESFSRLEQSIYSIGGSITLAESIDGFVAHSRDSQDDYGKVVCDDITLDTNSLRHSITSDPSPELVQNLATLESMGYRNRTLNASLLGLYDGDLELVRHELNQLK